MPLIIVANIYAKSDHEERVRAELEKLVEPTRAEPGCLRYDLHRDSRQSEHFMFYEIWESRELWEAHMNSPHIAAYMAATERAVDRFLIGEMERIA